jgi:hypothetical protein
MGPPIFEIFFKSSKLPKDDNLFSSIKLLLMDLKILEELVLSRTTHRSRQFFQESEMISFRSAFGGVFQTFRRNFDHKIFFPLSTLGVADSTVSFGDVTVLSILSFLSCNDERRDHSNSYHSFRFCSFRLFLFTLWLIIELLLASFLTC